MYANTEHAPEQGDPRAPDAAQELRREVKEFVKLIAWFLVLFLVLKLWVIEVYEVQGESMQPALESKDHILVLKLPHVLSQTGWFGDWDPISPADVIVFDSPDNTNKRYVKRVIAEGPPGSRGAVAAEQIGSEPHVSVRIVEGRVYVNNRALTEDFVRETAFDPHEHAAETLLGPKQYYVLGDNHAVSKDSRSFGPVDDDVVIGKAVLRFWPLSKAGRVR